ncbi:MAG: DUF1801 domain-containing protein [Candidatus Thermoplasmatota archaeon]|nr:DUF1801 domain-containing protein [Candidatus Thermoplasmatota archaeon]
MDARIAEYIKKQPSPQQEIIQRVRAIFQKALPGCEEKMMWGVVTVADGKFYIAAMKTRVHVGFAITGLSKEEQRLFEGSGKTMRHIKLHSVDDVDEKTLVKLIQLVDKKAICSS